MKKTLIGITAAAAALGGLAFANTGASAVPTAVGSCSGTFGIGKITPGLGNTNQAVTASVKGSALGSCSFSAPATGGGAITKWGSKLTSPVADCVSEVVPDNSEYPLNGKLSIAFAATKFDSYVATTKLNPSGTKVDTVGVKGIVTKGDAVGSFLEAEIYFDPIIKDKLGSLTTSSAGTTTGYSLDLGNALGCQDNTGATAANITGIAVGDGTSALGTTGVTGIAFTQGV